MISNCGNGELKKEDLCRDCNLNEILVSVMIKVLRKLKYRVLGPAFFLFDSSPVLKVSISKFTFNNNVYECIMGNIVKYTVRSLRSSLVGKQAGRIDHVLVRSRYRYHRWGTWVGASGPCLPLIGRI